MTAAPTGPAYDDVGCHRGLDDNGRDYCVGHGQDWPCAAPTGPDPRTDAAVRAADWAAKAIRREWVDG